jgi:hypothetical protein
MECLAAAAVALDVRVEQKCLGLGEVGSEF